MSTLRVRWPASADGESREEVFENCTVLRMDHPHAGLVGWIVKVPGTQHTIVAEPGMLVSDTPEVDPRDDLPRDARGRLALIGKPGEA